MRECVGKLGLGELGLVARDADDQTEDPSADIKQHTNREFPGLVACLGLAPVGDLGEAGASIHAARVEDPRKA